MNETSKSYMVCIVYKLWIMCFNPIRQRRRGSFSCEVTSLLATSTLHQLGISTTCREDVAVQNSPCIALLSVRKSRCDHLPSAATVQQLAIVLQFCKIHNIQQFTTTSTSTANMLQMSILRCEIEQPTLSLSSPAFSFNRNQILKLQYLRCGIARSWKYP